MIFDGGLVLSEEEMKRVEEYRKHIGEKGIVLPVEDDDM